MVEVRNLEKKKMEEFSDLMVENGMNIEYTIKGIENYNVAHGSQKKNIMGVALRVYRKIGLIFFLIMAPLFIIALTGNILFLPIAFLNMAVGLIWCQFLGFYLKNALSYKHCDICQGICCRNIIYEAQIPGQTYDTIEEKTVSDTVKDKEGNEIGQIERKIKVNVTKDARWTIYECKKCHNRKIEITIHTTER